MGIKWSGAGFIWEKIDGWKTYIQAGAEMLTGVAGMAAGAAAEADRFVAQVHGLSDLVGFARDLVKNPDPAAIACAVAWGTFLHGWGVMAKKHADDKKHAEIVTAAAIGAAIGPPKPQP